MTAAQKKKLMMVVLMLAAGGLMFYQLAPVLGLTDPPKKKKASNPSQAQTAASAKKENVPTSGPAQATPSSPRVAPAPSAPTAKSQSPMVKTNKAEAAPVTRKAHPHELAGLLADSDFIYETKDLRDPFSDLQKLAREKHEGDGSKSYQPAPKIEGILWNDRRPLVIIDGKIYERGQSFDGVGKIFEILPSHIVVIHGMDSFEISVSKLDGQPVSKSPLELQAGTSAPPSEAP